MILFHSSCKCTTRIWLTIHKCHLLYLYCDHGWHCANIISVRFLFFFVSLKFTYQKTWKVFQYFHCFNFLLFSKIQHYTLILLLLGLWFKRKWYIKIREFDVHSNIGLFRTGNVHNCMFDYTSTAVQLGLLGITRSNYVLSNKELEATSSQQDKFIYVWILKDVTTF